MRFWLPVLSGLFAALYIVQLHPDPCGLMSGLLSSLTGLDIALHLNK